MLARHLLIFSLALILTGATLLLAQESPTQAHYARISDKITAEKLLNFTKTKSPLVIRNQQLGVISLHINYLAPHSRITTIDNIKASTEKNESLLLGSGYVSIRRGIAYSKSSSRKITASISARLLSDGVNKPAYLKIRFTKERKIGRIFEITIPIESKLAHLRHISLRALSSRFCGISDGIKPQTQSAITAKSPFIINQNQLPSRAAADSNTKIFTVSTDCDFECASKLGGSAANDKILEFYNSVNTFYGRDFNINFNVTSQVTRTNTSQYPSSATNSDTLLSLFQSQAPKLHSADFKHLITGKTMQSHVVGLSFVGVACESPSFTLGYSQHVNDLLTPIIIAHETGHNLNATHDPNSEGIMTTVLSVPFPTSFSQFSKTQIENYIDGLGGLACYDSGASANAITASLTARFSKSNFRASITQPKGSSCSVELRVAQSKNGLSTQSTSIFSGSISNIETISLLASSLPKVKVKRAGLKALIWLNTVSSCSEGTANSAAKSINVAIAPNKATGIKTFRSTKNWISRVKNTIQRS